MEKRRSRERVKGRKGEKEKGRNGEMDDNLQIKNNYEILFNLQIQGNFIKSVFRFHFFQRIPACQKVDLQQTFHFSLFTLHSPTTSPPQLLPAPAVHP
jgi:hypothetical protein